MKRMYFLTLKVLDPLFGDASILPNHKHSFAVTGEPASMFNIL